MLAFDALVGSCSWSVDRSRLYGVGHCNSWDGRRLEAILICWSYGEGMVQVEEVT